jgi:aspartyl-tRNA(Asn)/glutamyl-tRNA(Gln) amidotransferase subunit B
MTWLPTIGLEIHVQLATKSKLFSGSATTYGAEPNTQACALDLGMPGTLPVLNQEAVRMAVKFGLAIDAEVNSNSVFARKNYFYPDLPKGYQISQFEQPIVGKGFLPVINEHGKEVKIEITRAHLEEDAGKLIHQRGFTAVDLNRAGTPLLEVVSEPVMHSAKEAVCYAKAMHNLVRYLEICDGNLQEGSFRCDVNISLSKPGEPLGTRAEIKNLNSFRFIEQAINYEIKRQSRELEAGREVKQETRLYNEAMHKTKPMRSKEEAHDYRYFPDPDLLPVAVSEELLKQVKTTIPELPIAKRQRFLSDYQLKTEEADFFVEHKDFADYLDSVIQASQGSPAICASWVRVELGAQLNKHGIAIASSPISAEQLAQLIDRVSDKTISGKIAKTVFFELWNGASSADEVIAQQGLKQVTDSAKISAMIDEVLNSNPEQLAEYKAGKEKMFAYFVGQVMRTSKGKANPAQVNQLLKEKLLN